MPLDDLAPVLKILRTWARTHHVQAAEGVVELSDAMPRVTVEAYDTADIDLFLLLADQLKAKAVAIDAVVLEEEDIEMAKAFAGRISEIEERATFNRRITAARGRIGQLHRLRLTAFAPGLDRALIYNATTDWGDALFGFMRPFPDEEDSSLA